MILNGWKEISKHLGRGVRTVQRWEQIGLPVRRPNRKDRTVVVAFSEELDEWLKTGHEAQPKASDVSGKPVSRMFPYRILIVDDDEALLVATAALLSREGYVIRTARDGFEALAALRGSIPDVLISDLKMANMSGFELLGVVRKRFPAMAVIAKSGEFIPGSLPAVLADRYLQKNGGAGELLETIGELILQSPLRTQPARSDSAPVWIPRSTDGYVVLTCLACLRSFSVPTRRIEIGGAATDRCIHCDQDVRYRIDTKVAATAGAPSSVLKRLQKRVQESKSITTHTKRVGRDSKRVR